MSTDQLQRPDFYEGQYLGASDLDAVVDYTRLRTARHSLGAHTWGIAVGLALKEEESLAGGDAVDVFVQPGYAVDGFGRTIVVTRPHPVPASLFADESSGRVRVWLRHVEQATGFPKFGFAVCETEDQTSRIVETFELVVGDRSRIERRDEITVAGRDIDVIQALHDFDERAPLLCDGSVPFQSFPDPAEANWLIPLGYVRWDAAAGQIVATTEEDRLLSRAFRRYLGIVAQDVHAADGLIRLGRRGVEADGPAIFDTCEAADAVFDTENDLDLSYDEDTERVRPVELVWIDGDLRLIGDGRLFGGKLEFRREDGDVDDAPLWIRRIEDNGMDGKDLQVLVGEAAAGRNRFVVGRLTLDADGNASVVDRVMVQDDGRVGIGTPNSTLSRPLTIRADDGGEEDLLGFEDTAGVLKWHVNQLPGGADGLNFAESSTSDSRLFLQTGGRVGIGSTAPAAKLEVAGVPTSAGGSALGSDLWLRVGDGGDSGRFWVEYGSQAAPLAVLSDLDDPPRIQFQQTGGGDEANPDFESWIGHAQGSSSNIAIMNGNLGVGTLRPRATVHVGTGTDASFADDGGYLVLGDVDGANLVLDNNEIMARSDGAASTLHLQADGGDVAIHNNQSAAERVVVKDGGDVGLGTATPAERLDVRGNIKLGAGGDFFAIGGLQNLRLIAGRVSSAGNTVAGTGFTPSRTAEGSYSISFATAFTQAPIVVATCVDALDDDNVATIRSLAQSSFAVRIKSVGGENDPQDTAFTFLAFGPRA